jgi:hypothetical protein
MTPPETDRNRATEFALPPRADPAAIAEINPLRLYSKLRKQFHYQQNRAVKPKSNPVWGFSGQDL